MSEHATRAQQYVDQGFNATPDAPTAAVAAYLTAASVHACLAIAEQLERLNEQFEHVIAPEGTGGFVKVRKDV